MVTACPLCGATASLVHLTGRDFSTDLGEFPILRCASCRGLYTGGRPVAADDMYPSTYQPYQPVGARLSVVQTILRKISLAAGSRSPRHGCFHGCYRRIVDVGCGGGGMLTLLEAQGARPIGVDLSLTALQGAPRRFPLVVADPAALPFPPDAFDGAVLHHVLEHSDEPLRLLGEVRAVTRSGARIRVAVPRAQSILARLMGTAFDGWDVPRHRVHFEAATLVDTLTQAGLEVEAVRQFPEPGMALRSIEHRIGRALPKAILVAGHLALGVVLWALWPFHRRSSVLDVLVRRA